MLEQVYIGTQLKRLIEINADNFSMEDDDYNIVLRCHFKKLEYTKEDVFLGDDNNYYLLIDTSKLCSGTLQMIVTAFVPDSDFEDGVRKEVTRVDICELIMP